MSRCNIFSAEQSMTCSKRMDEIGWQMRKCFPVAAPRTRAEAREAQLIWETHKQRG